MKYNEELYKTVHWRSFRRIVTNLANIERVNLVGYDLNHVTCYTTMGFTFLGRNVTFDIPGTNNRACFVEDNQYDMFEIPLNGCARNPKGKYLFVAHNKSFDYWIFGELVYENNKAHYDPYGFYHAAVDKENVVVKKEVSGNDVGYGENIQTKLFDAMSVRQRAYGNKASDILASQKGVTNNINTLKGGNKVKIYKKK